MLVTLTNRVSWFELHITTMELSKKIIRHMATSDHPHSFTKIISVGTDSMVAATILSRAFGIRYIEVLNVAQHPTTGRLFLGNKVNPVDETSLFVLMKADLDGIASAIKQEYPKSFFAGLFVHRQAKEFVHVSAMEVPNPAALVLPWEQDQERA